THHMPLLCRTLDSARPGDGDGGLSRKMGPEETLSIRVSNVGLSERQYVRCYPQRLEAFTADLRGWETVPHIYVAKQSHLGREVDARSAIWVRSMPNETHVRLERALPPERWDEKNNMFSCSEDHREIRYGLVFRHLAEGGRVIVVLGLRRLRI